MRIAITGGYGFIGSNLVNFLSKKYPDYEFWILDITDHYAACRVNVRHKKNVVFYQDVDITKRSEVERAFKNNFEAVIHLAAESHVDNSISDPLRFVKTNVLGTTNLLGASLETNVSKFYHVSTDEVYGHLGKTGQFTEDTPYAPRSPYSASKAASDHMVRSFHQSFGLPILISNCSNNYGKYQHDEKLIPTVIRSIMNQTEIPVYGKGDNIRDWLSVDDHCKAIDLIFHQGKIGQTYNIGGDCEMENIQIVKRICDLIDQKMGSKNSQRLISFVEDRKGHDFRYSVDCSKLKNELNWKQETEFSEGLSDTVDWYITKYKKDGIL